MNNEVFPLSEKYIDFLNYDSSTEFLEGTTFAGKTTVAIPKFMFKIMNSNNTYFSHLSILYVDYF